MLKKIKGPQFAERNLVIILVLLIAVLSIVSHRFLSYNNIMNLLRQTSIIGVMAIGMTFVILSGGIDLSVGSVLAFSSVLSAMMMKAGLPIPLAILLALFSGTVLGLLMGILIHKGSVPAFIATLGGMTMVRGAVMLISGARKISGLPKDFKHFAVAKYLGVPGMVWVWIIIVIIGFIIAKYTVFGRNVYAIGSNEEAARLSGIKIGKNIYGIYAFGAFTSAVAGILMTARLGNGVPTSGTGYELDVIAAVVVGGASMSGAVGTILGTVLGTVIIAAIRNGGNLLGINPFILDITVGGLIVFAVLFDQLNKKKR
ncbi:MULTISPECIES: ABC transporter permease [unclassified Oceanispirochaeta]|uniref:ABC transporter permease n=1 Tax=unclassified Oceanispirochaeta TaxID=2635722 RepID=UPI000E08D54C|nr:MULTISPECIES: ABC transporter permease [unclassified Oceanispirochaeta]MBF9016689.1 ABC transporter permease [Oceanispirochaeta sp. M2]NPD73106.1 ABC transporter permease [Oceanispirochaeta sp. M1]RDG31207.1 ABC transporter permease [Oceanispirochaeta sp. M1]